MYDIGIIDPFTITKTPLMIHHMMLQHMRRLQKLMHSVHNNRCPTYISYVVQSTKTVPTRGCLRSAESTDYILPRLRTKFAERGFSYAGPAEWNRLPESIRRTSSQAAFKWQLKTFLFSEAFNIRCDSS